MSPSDRAVAIDDTPRLPKAMGSAEALTRAIGVMMAHGKIEDGPVIDALQAILD